MTIFGTVFLSCLAAFLPVVWIGGRFFEWRQVFNPDRTMDADPGRFGAPFEDVRFVAEDSVQLHGWWIPGAEDAGTLIYLHGAAGNMSTRAELMGDLQRLGLNIFAFDYRGYGKSRGFPTEEGTYRDARAAYEVVRARYEDMEEPPIVLYGHSLGGAVAIHLAQDKPVRGLIVEGSFTSITEIAELRHPRLPVRRFGGIRFDSLASVPRLTVPKLFAHSRDDETIPFEIGRKLFATASEPKQFAELRGAHSDSKALHTPAYWAQVQAFIDGVLDHN